MTRRAFISHSSKNVARVRNLAADIESLGHEVWYDQKLTGGRRWWEQILSELRACDVFVFALSAEAVDSRACVSELEYAEALGKQILPVVIERDFSENLLPPLLGEVQRVDYTTEDKAAFAALSRALSSLPASTPLPDTLPTPPPVPASYLFDLKAAFDETGTMSRQRQDELVEELRHRIKEGFPVADLLALTRRFRHRDDVLVRVDSELAALEATLETDQTVHQDEPRLDQIDHFPVAAGGSPRERPAGAPPSRAIHTPRGPLELGTFGIRLGGFAIDVMLIIVAGGLLWFITFAVMYELSYVINMPDVIEEWVWAEDEDLTVVEYLAGAVFFAVVVPIALWIFNSSGRSPGKLAVGIRIVDPEGANPGVRRGLTRTGGSALSVLAVGLGYLSAAWDEEIRTWHDKMAHTYVVRA